MPVRIVGFILALATVASLELIQLVGAGYDPPRPPWFTALTVMMDLCLISSSAILWPAFLRRGGPLLGALFAANLAVMAMAFALRVAGVEFSRPPILFGAGLYWLTLYLVGLALGWRTLLGRRDGHP